MTRTRKPKIPPDTLSVCQTVQIDIEDLCYQVTPEQAMQLIITLDEAQEEWGFTEAVFKHFQKLHTVYLEMEKEDNA